MIYGGKSKLEILLDDSINGPGKEHYPLLKESWDKMRNYR